MASFSLVQFMVSAPGPVPETALLTVIDIRVVMPTELVPVVIGPNRVCIFSNHIKNI